MQFLNAMPQKYGNQSICVSAYVFTYEKVSSSVGLTNSLYKKRKTSVILPRSKSFVSRQNTPFFISPPNKLRNVPSFLSRSYHSAVKGLSTRLIQRASMRWRLLRLTVKILAILWHADNLFPSQLTGMLNIDLNDFKKLIFFLHCSKTHFRSVVYFLRDKKMYIKEHSDCITRIAKYTSNILHK